MKLHDAGKEMRESRNWIEKWRWKGFVPFL